MTAGESYDEGNSGYGVAPEPRRVIWTDESPSGEQDEIFEPELALAALLIAGRVFLNNHWFKGSWPAEAKAATSINVNCNDVFAWGCADAEPMSFGDLRSVYEYYVKDPEWGCSVWCAERRRQMPQAPVVEYIKKAGIWNLHEMNLRPCRYDGHWAVIHARRYHDYERLAVPLGATRLPLNGEWWPLWAAYAKSHPDWRTPEVEEGDQAALAEWDRAAGYATTDSV